MKKSVVGGKKNKSKKLFFFSPPNPATPPEFSVNILVPNPKNYQDVPNSQSPKNTQQNPMRQSVSRASAANPLDLSRPLGRKAGGGLPRSEILPSRQSPAEKIKKNKKRARPPNLTNLTSPTNFTSPENLTWTSGPQRCRRGSKKFHDTSGPQSVSKASAVIMGREPHFLEIRRNYFRNSIIRF